MRDLGNLVASLASAKTVAPDRQAPLERFVTSLDLGRKLAAPKRAAVTPDQDRLRHDLQEERQWLEHCVRVLGRHEMRCRVRRWRYRWRREPELLRDILGEITEQRARGKRIRNAGAYAECLWQKAKGAT